MHWSNFTSSRRWNSFGFLSPSLTRRSVRKNCGGNQPSCRTVHSNKTRPEVACNSMRRNACILHVECFVWNKVMPRNCFEKIRQHLCLNNCINMLLRDNPANDKLFKVRPLLDRLANTFRKEYRPSKFVSIDEGMVKYKGRFGFKQYMPTKPVKWGIKVWVHADATNSFVSTMQVYTGKKDAG